MSIKNLMYKLIICIIPAMLFLPMGTTIASREYVVAVIDTGVDYSHPDIKDHMWINTTDLPGAHGYDFINQDADPMDDFGHGTHCAGIILQEAKKLGLDGRVKIMALKYMIEDGSGEVAQAIQAYRYVINAKKRGVPVVAVSNSWGGSDNPKELEDVIREAGELGILSICAAGNSGENLDVNKTFPSGYTMPHNIVVAAATKDEQLASFSCFGKYVVHVAAPGTEIRSCYTQEAYIPGGNLVDAPFEWVVQKTPDGEAYTEGNTETVPQNQLQYEIGEKVEAESFIGLEFSVDASEGASGLCMVEAYQFNAWERIGGFQLEDSNFNNIKWFPLDASASKLRLLAVNVSEGMNVRINKMGYGKTTGRYAVLSGTSMATPAVVAEAVWLMNRLPEASPEEIRARIIGGVRPLIPGKVASDGIVDAFRALNNPRPVITGVVRKGDDVTLQGFFFGIGGDVRLEDEEAIVSRWTGDSIDISTSKHLDEYTSVTITRDDGVSASQLVILPHDGGSAWQSIAPLPVALTDAACAGIDGFLYLVGGTDDKGQTNEKVYRYDVKANKWDVCAALPDTSNADRFAYGMSSAVCHGKMYIWTFDPVNESNSLYAFDPRTKSWQDMPLESGLEPRAASGIIAYDDYVWVVGGLIKGEKYAEYAGKGIPVWSFNVDSMTWRKHFALSEERYEAIVGTTNSGIVVTGGRQDETIYVQTTDYLTAEGLTKGASLPFAGLCSSNTMVACTIGITLMTDGNSFPLKGLFLNRESGEWQPRLERLDYGQRQNMSSGVVDGYLYVVGGMLDSRTVCDASRLKLNADNEQ